MLNCCSSWVMMHLYLAYSCLLLHFFYKHSQAGISVGITRIVRWPAAPSDGQPLHYSLASLRVYPDSMLCPYLGIRRGNIAGLAKFTRDFPDCRENSVWRTVSSGSGGPVQSLSYDATVTLLLSESDDWNNTLFTCRIMDTGEIMINAFQSSDSSFVLYLC